MWCYLLWVKEARNEYWDNEKHPIDNGQQTRGAITQIAFQACCFSSPTNDIPAHNSPFPFLLLHTWTCQTQSIFKEVYLKGFHIQLCILTYKRSTGKIQELRAELNSDKRDPKHQRKKTVMKKIVANMTMGNDMSPLFPDILNVMNVPILEIKKMVYLYLINYARSKPDMAMMAMTTFIKVSSTQLHRKDKDSKTVYYNRMSKIPIRLFVLWLFVPWAIFKSRRLWISLLTLSDTVSGIVILMSGRQLLFVLANYTCMTTFWSRANTLSTC